MSSFLFGFVLGGFHLYLLCLAADILLNAYVFSLRKASQKDDSPRSSSPSKLLAMTVAAFRVFFTASLAIFAVLECGLSPITLGLGLITAMFFGRIFMLWKLKSNLIIGGEVDLNSPDQSSAFAEEKR